MFFDYFRFMFVSFWLNPGRVEQGITYLWPARPSTSAWWPWPQWGLGILSPRRLVRQRVRYIFPMDGCFLWAPEQPRTTSGKWIVSGWLNQQVTWGSGQVGSGLSRWAFLGVLMAHFCSKLLMQKVSGWTVFGDPSPSDVFWWFPELGQFPFWGVPYMGSD